MQRLLEVLQRLVDAGNSVVVIEHNLDVIKSADRLIDMGPEGGEEGGMAIAVGTPEEVAAEPASHTGRFLAELLTPAKRPARAGGETAAEAAQTPRAGRRVSAMDDLAPPRRGCGRRSGAGMSATRCRGTGRRIHWEFMRREAFVRWPINGNVLEALREGRLEVGRGRAARAGRVDHRAGQRARADRRGHFPQQGVMIAAQELVEIGEHCMLANGCFVSDASHRYDDPEKPITWQGFESKGPTRIGDNCWLGANVVVTSGVSIGERCVIGANSVVTRDIEPFSIAAGAPARVIRKIEYERRVTVTAAMRAPSRERAPALSGSQSCARSSASSAGSIE